MSFDPSKLPQEPSVLHVELHPEEGHEGRAGPPTVLWEKHRELTAGWALARCHTRLPAWAVS